MTMPAVPLSTPIVKEIDERGNVEKQPINLTVTPVKETLVSLIAKPGQTSQSEQVHSMRVDHPAEQEPTAKDILQAIRDLGSKFHLLATNERVDALDAKHLTAQLLGWLHGTGGVDDVGISTVGRQWMHAWDPSVATGVQGYLETSASAA
ncbi:hypothetical protein BDR06DRAFT_966806 [Suillus hirtellus]|nr:hypothetical protein BDR06DRAFT_966806 [Suillus hirtellus]